MREFFWTALPEDMKFTLNRRPTPLGRIANALSGLSICTILFVVGTGYMWNRVYGPALHMSAIPDAAIFATFALAFGLGLLAMQLSGCLKDIWNASVTDTCARMIVWFYAASLVYSLLTMLILLVYVPR